MRKRPETIGQHTRAQRKRLHEILRRFVRSEDRWRSPQEFVRVVVARFEKDMGTYIVDVNE